MILIALGTRPQIIKFVPLYWELINRNLPFRVINTGQHYDYEMCDSLFHDFNLPLPDYNLDVGGGSQSQQIGLSLLRIEPLLHRINPSVCLVFGDTNSTLSISLASNKSDIPLAHIEAGLRSFNSKMPEETNRILVDRLSNWNFCPTKQACQNLESEGLTKNIHFVGDIMYDLANSDFSNSKISEKSVYDFGLSAGKYCLLTFHRAENINDPEKIMNILSAMNKVSKSVPVIWAAHPSTLAKIKLKNIEIPSSILVTKPLSYFELASLQRYAKVIFTDSGGIQKEAYFHKTPCITLRDETEWVETIHYGWNSLAGSNQDKILHAFENCGQGSPFDDYGDGSTSTKIVDTLLIENIINHK